MIAARGKRDYPGLGDALVEPFNFRMAAFQGKGFLHPGIADIADAAKLMGVDAGCLVHFPDQA